MPHPAPALNCGGFLCYNDYTLYDASMPQRLYPTPHAQKRTHQTISAVHPQPVHQRAGGGAHEERGAWRVADLVRCERAVYPVSEDLHGQLAHSVELRDDRGADRDPAQGF